MKMNFSHWWLIYSLEEERLYILDIRHCISSNI
jgi:hypothetical protein